jgi:hypothetical protein
VIFAEGIPSPELNMDEIEKSLRMKRLNWWARRDLNPRPTDYESAALTTELQARIRITSDYGSQK